MGIQKPTHGSQFASNVRSGFADVTTRVISLTLIICQELGNKFCVCSDFLLRSGKLYN
jgi:hypothetical protein